MRAISYTAAVLMIVAIGGCSNVEESGQAYERHSAPPSTMSIDRLRCEYLPDPLGIDAISPRLSWIVASEKRAQRQTAYRILAASSPDKLKSNEIDLWDTGKILSDQTTQIAYNGKSLSSGREYFWKVRVWDKAGSASKWSEDASFSMGIA